MLTRLDHVVMLVRDLELAASDYRRLGFAVTPGGEHADGLTRNALVPFQDGTYLELVAFLDPEDPTDNVWGWREFAGGEGLIDYCAASDDLDSEARRLGSLGWEIYGPDEGGRRLPDGTEIRWRSARIGQEGRLLPFLIEDLTPRDRRVPAGSAADHPNGATGISRLELSTPDTPRAADSLAALAETTEDTNLSVRLGACMLSPVEKKDEREGPTFVELAREGPGTPRELDPLLAHGAGIRLRSEW